jgi:hypothetical protein
MRFLDSGWVVRPLPGDPGRSCVFLALRLQFPARVPVWVSEIYREKALEWVSALRRAVA